MTEPPIYPIPGFSDPVSSLSHLLGAGVFLVLSLFLLRRGGGNWGRVFFLGVFAFAGVFLLSMSGVYHLLAPDGIGRAVLQRLDHGAIFVLIAGTFTPVHGILFRGWLRWLPLFLIWTVAATGITLKTIFFNDVSEWLGLALYLGMGWIGISSGVSLYKRFGFRFIRPLLWGALAYTAGAVLEFLRWPIVIPGVVHTHELFHVAVLAGLFCHWRFVMQFAAGPMPERSVSEALDPGSALPSSGVAPSDERRLHSRAPRYNAENAAKGVSMAATIRVGAVNYLNTKPLIRELEAIAPNVELVLDVPSRLADELRAGRLDVALIPAIEYFRSGKYSIVPDIAIATRGPVLSVTLFSKTPWAGIRRVALDEGSRTSAALTQILLRKRYGVQAEVVPLPMDRAAEEADADAVLLIGDRAMQACLPGFGHAYDLGQEWHDWTGLPFVYAFWAVRERVDLGNVADALREAKRRGCDRTGIIAHEEAPKLGLDAGFCRRYLASILHFDLGPREQAGLHHYYMLARELGLAPRGVSLEFYHHPHLAESR